MNQKEYLAKRTALLAEIEGLLKDGKVDEANKKMKDVEVLDAKWEEVKLANANLNALKDSKKVVDLENKSEGTKEGQIVGSLEDAPPVDNEKAYEAAWAKVMQGRKLDKNEQSVFDKVNAEFSNAYTHDTGNTPTLIPQSVVSFAWRR